MTRRTPILSDAAAVAAHNKFFLLREKARGVHHVEPKCHFAAYLSGQAFPIISRLPADEIAFFHEKVFIGVYGI